MKRRVSRHLATSWDEFERLHGLMLRESSPFEYQFFETVLRNVPNLRPEQVTPQFHIQDSRGRNRYIDFVVNISTMPKLALEVDGYDKAGTGEFMSHDQWDDFNYRQNEVVLQGMKLLRFSNREFTRRPHDAIRQIESAIDQLTTSLSENVLGKGIAGLGTWTCNLWGDFKDGFDAGWNGSKKETEQRRKQVREALKAKYGL